MLDILQEVVIGKLQTFCDLYRSIYPWQKITILRENSKNTERSYLNLKLSETNDTREDFITEECEMVCTVLEC